MTRRRFYAPPEAFASGGREVTLSADEARHARNVLRLHSSDEVFVFDGRGREFRCVIDKLSQSIAKLDLIEQVEPAKPESPLNLTLAVSLLKGEKFDLVIQKATELGVNLIIPISANRADARIVSEAGLQRKLDRWRRIALESAKQSGRARLLGIEPPSSFESLLKLPSITGQMRVMFAERDGGSVLDLTRELSPAALLALIGPEGGFTDNEIAAARETGWKIITLGGRVLRAETAAIVIAAVLQHRFGDVN